MEANTIDTAKINIAFIEEQATPWKKAAEAVAKTAEAYLSDIESRKRTLQEQAKGYNEEMSALKQERAKLAANIADLSSRGDIDSAAKADIKLEALDKQLHDLERKLRIINGASPKGDPALYASAQTAYNAMTQERAPYLQRIDELTAAVDEEIKRLEAIRKELSYNRDINPGFSAHYLWEKVNRHYNDLDRREQEAAERAAAERKAQEAAKGSTRISLSMQ